MNDKVAAAIRQDWYDVCIPSIRQQEVRFNRTSKEWVLHPSGQYTGHVFFDTRDRKDGRRFDKRTKTVGRHSQRTHTQDVQRLRRVKGLLYTYMTDAAPGWVEKIKELRK